MKNFNRIAVALASILAATFVSCKDEPKTDPDPEEIAVGLSVKELEFDAADTATKTVDVTGTNWTATPSDEWIEVTSGEDGIEVSVDPTETEREGSIEVKNSISTETITVKQNVPEVVVTPLSADPSSVLLTSGAVGETVTVTSNTAWEATTEDTWLTITQNENSFTVAATQNYAGERVGEITVQNESETITVAITQSVHIYPVAKAKMYTPSNYGAGTSDFLLTLESFDAAKGEMGGWRVALELVGPEVSKDKYSIDIPTGTYTVSTSGSPMTIDNMLFFAQKFDENGIALQEADDKGFYQSGTVTVEGDSNEYHIEFNLTLKKNGIGLSGSYVGPIFCQNNEMWSSFTGDVDLGNVSSNVELIFADNILGGESYLWIYNIVTEGVTKEGNQYKGNGYVFSGQMASEITGEGAYLPDGGYQIVNDTKTPGTARSGIYQDGNLGMWLYVVENDELTGAARIVSGTLTTSRSGNTYTMVLAGVDDVGNDITATFSGPATIKPYL